VSVSSGLLPTATVCFLFNIHAAYGLSPFFRILLSTSEWPHIIPHTFLLTHNRFLVQSWLHLIVPLGVNTKAERKQKRPGPVLRTLASGLTTAPV
jgi:hypothetical protein